MGARSAAATISLFLGAAAAAWAAVTVVSGGFAVRAAGLALSSRDPIRPLIAAAFFVTAAFVLDGGTAVRRLRAAAGGRDRIPARVAGGAAACVLVCSLAWNTRAAGGSDSSCYVLQADAFAHGRLTLTHPLADVLSDAPPAIFAPTGFLASPVRPREAVPICGAGLALAMAGASIVAGRDAVFAVVPLLAALAVWLTFVLGRQLDNEVTGAAAAVLLACSPIFLYQAVQPMSDVPAAALWLAALAACARRDRPGAAIGGACASFAVLTRPSLALAIVPLLFLQTGTVPVSKTGTVPVSSRSKRGQSPFSKWGLSPFFVAAVPAVAALLALNLMRYGRLLGSGYGNPSALFSLSNVTPNLARYPRWILETQTPILLLAAVGLWSAARARAQRRVAAVAALSAIAVVVPYLFYTVFDDWWYIRFLLPALPVLLVFCVRGALALIPRHRRFAAAGICLVLCPWFLHIARVRHVFDLQALESRFVLTGTYANAQPATTVFLAVQQSGSIRYHGDRPTLAWDALPPDGLDATIARLRAAGHSVLIALEDAEEVAFRRRFRGQQAGALDWPPAAEIHAPVRVRVWPPSEPPR